MTELQYLDLTDLLAVSAAATGGTPQVRDWGLLEAALARPRATVFGQDAYPDVLTKCAALIESLVNNHAFVDGNERIALVAGRLFLAWNQIKFSGADDDKFDLVIDIAENRLEGVAAIRDRLRRLSRDQSNFDGLE